MKKMRLCLLLLMFLSKNTLSSSIINGDFSTGDLSGWNAESASVVNYGSDYAAKIITPLPYSSSATGIWQYLSLNAGDTITGWAQWFGSIPPNYEQAFISLGDANIISTFTGPREFLSTNEITLFSLVAPVSGDYYVLASVPVENPAFYDANSFLLVDNFSVNNNLSNIPEPTTIALFSIGFIAYRFHKKAQFKQVYNACAMWSGMTDRKDSFVVRRDVV